MIKAIIFDMDGLLIDSEPLWEIAEIEVFKTIGIFLNHISVKETIGLRLDEVVEYRYRNKPWHSPAKKEIEDKITLRLIELIIERGQTRNGVGEIVTMFEKAGLPMVIATSSSDRIISAVVKKLSIGKKIRFAYSAEHEAYGKPHPGVFITTAMKLGIIPECCLVFEDSPNGVLAAKAAKMKCVAVPSIENNKGFCIADLTINSLKDFSMEMLKKF